MMITTTNKTSKPGPYGLRDGRKRIHVASTYRSYTGRLYALCDIVRVNEINKWLVKLIDDVEPLPPVRYWNSVTPMPDTQITCPDCIEAMCRNLAWGFKQGYGVADG